MIVGLILFIALIFAGYKLFKDKPARIPDYELSPDAYQLLSDNVSFFRNLDDKQKKVFQNRVADFLVHVRITGIGTNVEDLDRILIASGAIIPIFAFPDWRYNNISEVLLYKDTFNADYSADGRERNILGMVGDGAMNRQMILSQPSVRSSFKDPEDGHNTVIHEFVHLIDKADGATDGIPEYLLSHPYILPWINRIHQTIKAMKDKGHSDINFYGATNDAEFFAVISEYFFERPKELKMHHPELYAMLEQMFRPVKR
jgi:Mlc titration factor MtfA (ptsG expression regulator)